jgi:hypothetical protein
LSSSCRAEPPASFQPEYATDKPIEAAAGIVVTEMKTPIRALTLDSVSETTPTSPASTATMTENASGELIRSATGRWPARKRSGVSPENRTARPNSIAATIAAANPLASASRPSLTLPRSRWLRPRATAMIAVYSGPTTIAATIRICELVRMPTAPISAAMISSR